MVSISSRNLVCFKSFLSISPYLRKGLTSWLHQCQRNSHGYCLLWKGEAQWIWSVLVTSRSSSEEFTFLPKELLCGKKSFNLGLNCHTIPWADKKKKLVFKKNQIFKQKMQYQLFFSQHKIQLSSFKENFMIESVLLTY